MRISIPVALAALATVVTPGADATAGAAAKPKPAATAANQPAAASPELAAPAVKQWELGNGLKVLFLPDHKAPVVTVQVFYHAGGKDEPADKRGIAHMFEHMMFKGSTHVRPEEHGRFIDSV